MIDSICVSWNPIKKKYLITVLTSSGLRTYHAKNMQKVIAALKEIEEKNDT